MIITTRRFTQPGAIPGMGTYKTTITVVAGGETYAETLNGNLTRKQAIITAVHRWAPNQRAPHETLRAMYDAAHRRRAN